MDARLIALSAQIAACNAQIAGMQAANDQRKVEGNSMAYGDMDFGHVADRLGLLAVDAARIATQWRSIDTAPTDGSVFLVGHIKGGELYWAHAAKRGTPPMQKLFYTRLGEAINQPTHWAPVVSSLKE